MQGFVAQDKFFLEAFSRAYALALVLCDDSEGMRAFAELIKGVLDEMELHKVA